MIDLAFPLHAPHGSSLNTPGWLQEAALRCLLNNLDPDVAEDPENLIVYGGRGKAARNVQSLHAIVRTLERLESLGVPVVVVATKVDRISRGQRGRMEKGVREALGLEGETPLIPVSAHSGEGIKELWSAVARHLEASTE